MADELFDQPGQGRLVLDQLGEAEPILRLTMCEWSGCWNEAAKDLRSNWSATTTGTATRR